MYPTEIAQQASGFIGMARVRAAVLLLFVCASGAYAQSQSPPPEDPAVNPFEDLHAEGQDLSDIANSPNGWSSARWQENGGKLPDNFLIRFMINSEKTGNDDWNERMENIRKAEASKKQAGGTGGNTPQTSGSGNSGARVGDANRAAEANGPSAESAPTAEVRPEIDTAPGDTAAAPDDEMSDDDSDFADSDSEDAAEESADADQDDSWADSDQTADDSADSDAEESADTDQDDSWADSDQTADDSADSDGGDIDEESADASEADDWVDEEDQ